MFTSYRSPARVTSGLQPGKQKVEHPQTRDLRKHEDRSFNSSISISISTSGASEQRRPT